MLLRMIMYRNWSGGSVNPSSIRTVYVCQLCHVLAVSDDVPSLPASPLSLPGLSSPSGRFSDACQVHGECRKW